MLKGNQHLLLFFPLPVWSFFSKHWKTSQVFVLDWGTIQIIVCVVDGVVTQKKIYNVNHYYWTIIIEKVKGEKIILSEGTVHTIFVIRPTCTLTLFSVVTMTMNTPWSTEWSVDTLLKGLEHGVGCVHQLTDRCSLLQNDKHPVLRQPLCQCVCMLFSHDSCGTRGNRQGWLV